jgi:hypothetical protein
MMTMAENKTKPTESSVTDFLNNIEDQQLRKDCFDIVDMMRKVSHSEPVLWGSAIIGFGTVHYVYESGREGDTVAIGFSPRKQNISLYLTGGLSKIEDELLQLGKFKTGKGCLYIKSLSDVNVEVLEKIFAKSFMEAPTVARLTGCFCIEPHPPYSALARLRSWNLILRKDALSPFELRGPHTPGRSRTCILPLRRRLLLH